MSTMKNLDFIIQNISMGPDEYNDNKELVNAHIQGDITFDLLPLHLQSAMIEWENDEMELEPKNNYDIQPWEAT